MKRNAAMATIASFFMIVFILFVVTPSAVAQSTSSEEAKYQRIFEQIYKYIDTFYVEVVTPEQLYEGAIKGMLESLDDPYSALLTDEEEESLTDTSSGEYAGVGLRIQKPNPETYDPETYKGKYPQYVEVVAPMEEGPSFRAGIHAGDYITKIEGNSVKELNITEVKNRLRGRKGTRVTFTILRGTKENNYTIVREIIEVPTVKYKMLSGTKTILGSKKIGYIKIIQFTSKTKDRVKDAILNLDKQGCSSLIIDVRGNPGGLLDSVVDVMDLFLSKGPIVSTKSRIRFENEIFTAKRSTTIVDKNLPIVILIDRYSASASEILAGAFKDTGRGTLIGETTYGKGSVQQARAISGVYFKLTTSRYYTPADINIDKIGIDPDIAIENPEFSDDEQDLLSELFDSLIIEKYVEKNKKPSELQIVKLIEKLQAEGYKFEDRILRRLIMQEVYRYWDFPPIFDISYDITLQAAIKELRGIK